jgi:hypothetical protein
MLASARQVACGNRRRGRRLAKLYEQAPPLVHREQLVDAIDYRSFKQRRVAVT